MEVVNEPVYVTQLYDMLERNAGVDEGGEEYEVHEDVILGSLNTILYGTSYSYMQLPRYKDEQVKDNDIFVTDLKNNIPLMKAILNEPTRRR